MGSLSGGGRALRPPTARSFPGQGLRTHAKNTLRTAPLQPAPEPVYEGGARSPTKPTNPYIVVIISQKRHFEQQKCKGFLHRLCKGFFGRVYRKNAGNGRFGRLLARNARLRREKAAKKGAAGLFAAADTRKRLNGEVWRTRRSAKVNSYRPAFPGRSIFAEGAGRALRSFRSPPSGRFALRATAHRADASLRCRAGGEFAPLGANIS